MFSQTLLNGSHSAIELGEAEDIIDIFSKIIFSRGIKLITDSNSIYSANKLES